MLGCKGIKDFNVYAPENSFGSLKECPKCGGNLFERTFVQRSVNIHCESIDVEHIKVKCLMCSYCEIEKTKDAK
jgi:predicted nucleic-acid-binding Zn-ribbon protein